VYRQGQWQRYVRERDDRTQPTQRFIIASSLLTFSLSNDHNASETTKRLSSSPYRRRGACCGRSTCTIQQLFDKCLGYRLVASLLIMWKAYQQTHAGTTPSRSKQGGLFLAGRRCRLLSSFSCNGDFFASLKLAGKNGPHCTARNAWHQHP
jgi:hypothetical protein